MAPFIIQKDYGSGRLVYINAMPLVNDKKIDPQILSKIMTLITDIVSLPTYNWTREDAKERFEMYVGSVYAKGVISIYSDSMTFTDSLSLQQKIRIVDYSNITFSLRAKEVRILPAMRGTYSQLFVTGPWKLLIFENGKLIETCEVGENSTMLVKNPKVNVLGETVMKETYWRKKSGHWGRTLTFYGDTAFTIYYSGTYLFIFDFESQGSFKSIIPYSDFAELYPHYEELAITIYLSLILLAVLMAFHKLMRKYRDENRYYHFNTSFRT